jgi:hypothetical protein
MCKKQFLLFTCGSLFYTLLQVFGVLDLYPENEPSMDYAQICGGKLKCS